MTSVSADEIF